MAVECGEGSQVGSQIPNTKEQRRHNCRGLLKIGKTKQIKSKANVDILVDFLPVFFLFLDSMILPSRLFYRQSILAVTNLDFNIRMYDLTIKF